MKKKSIRYFKNQDTVGLQIILLFLFVNLFNFCRAQELFLKKVNISDGLLGYDNYKMIEDHQGAIWVCSENGVVKFQGSTSKSFTNSDGLLINDVWNIEKDPTNRIWLRSYASGIQYIKNDSVFTVKNSTKYNEVQYAGFHRDTAFFTVKIEDRHERFYLNKKNELIHYKRFNNLGFEVQGDFSEYGFFLLTRLFGDTKFNYYYWIATGVIENTQSIFSNVASNEFEDTAPIYRSNNGISKGANELSLYAPSSKGFVPVLEELWDKISRFNIRYLSKDQIVVNVNSDIRVYTNILTGKRDTDAEKIVKDYFEHSNDIGEVLSDSKGNVWVMRTRAELYFIHNSARWASILDLKDENKWNMEISMPVQWKTEGQLIYVTHRGELYYFNYLTNEKKLLYSHIRALREFKLVGNKLYILRSRAMIIIELESVNNSVRIKRFKEYSLDAFHELESMAFEIINEKTFLLSAGYTLKLLNNDQISFEKIKGFQPLFRTEKIIQVNKLIVCRSATKCYFFDTTTSKEVMLDINSPSFIKYINGELYIGTFGNGCYKLNTQTLKLSHIFKSKEDVLNIVYNNGFYLCTSNGILFGDFLNGKFHTKKSYINNLYFSLRTNDVLVSKNILALTNRGTLLINQDKRDKYYQRFEDKNGIKFNLIATNELKSIESGSFLPNNKNSITFTLNDNSYFNITPVEYRYKLIGHSSQAQFVKNGSIVFSNLRAGHYTLVVESSSSKYGIFKNQKRFYFSVGKPFYASKIFFVSAILIALFILILANYIIKYFAFRKSQRVSKLRELEYQALQAQLNPHFVFNCLNNLQRMMILSDEREVNDYICSFAGLMRNILDNSKKKKITLSEEIELLENYLRIEKIRLGGTLNYSIALSDNIDSKKIEIYGMVFQPFVENAIIHGFLTSQLDKQINIEFVLNESNILVGSVTDNGIGREKAQLLKKHAVYKSWSSTILKEKSELLNVTRKNELSFDIIDLYENGEAKGTKVVVKMRIE